MLLQYLDAVGWFFWPVKFTTESENRLQLDSLSTSVNIDRLTVKRSINFDNGRQYVSCGQRQPPLSGAPVNKMAVNYYEGETDPSGFRVWLISTSLGTFLSPHIGSAWRARHRNIMQIVWLVIPGVGPGVGVPQLRRASVAAVAQGLLSPGRDGRVK